MNWRSSRIAVIDTETTGTNAAIDRVVEVAAVIVENGEIVDRFGSLVNLGPGVEIPEAATAIHGITDADVRNAPPFWSVSVDIVNFVRDTIPASYNARFDRAMLLGEFLRLNAQPMPEFLASNEWIDVLAWTRAHDPFARGTGRHKLTTVAARLGVEIGTAHRALGDCETAARVLWKMQSATMHRESGVAIMPVEFEELQLHQRRLQAEKDADWHRYVIRKRAEERAA